MEKYKYLIVGGGVAGITAAETIRENDPEGTIAVVSDEVHPLYSRVMLSKPNFFLGKIPFDQVWLKGQKLYEEKKITFLGGKIAATLDAATKILTLTDGTSINYEKLLIATGVQARRAAMPGAEKKGVHYLRTLEDGRAIMEAIKSTKQAVVVGGGFISFEMTDMLKLAGIETTLLLRERYIWEPILDEESGKMIEEKIEQAGIKILRQTEIVEITGEGRVENVVLKDGTSLPAQIALFGIGAVNNINIAKESGLATARGIVANEYLETSAPDVWTAGDVAEYKDLILDETIQLGSWVNAHKQGQVAGLNMVGKKEPFKFVSFYTTQGFDLNIAFVGDVNPSENRTIIKRISPESCVRLIVAGKELIGATLINKPTEMGLIAKLIENNVDVSTHLTELTDPNFDLKTLLN